MRGHNTRLKRLNKSIAEPAITSLTVDYGNGRLEAGLPVGAALPDGAERVMAWHGQRVLAGWLEAELWEAL